MARPRKEVLEGNTGWHLQKQWIQVERIADAYVSVVVNGQRNRSGSVTYNAVGVVSPGKNIVEIFDDRSHKIIGTHFKSEKAAKKAAEAWLKKYVREIKGPKGKKVLSDKCACEEIDTKANALVAKSVRKLQALKRATDKALADPTTY